AFSRVFVLFFFFQAEDGIRDRNVTGVQTCALPIYQFSSESVGDNSSMSGKVSAMNFTPGKSEDTIGSPEARASKTTPGKPSKVRSEERRVGKECRSRGWPSES